MPVALVTGAAVRVGRAIAVALADAGFELLLHAYRSREAVEALALELAARGHAAQTVVSDLSSESGVETLAAVARAQGALDVLVNNAGIYESAPFAEVTRAELARTLAVNLEAPFFLTQALLPLLLAAPAPCVVNVTDVAVRRPYPRYAPYLVSKAGLTMLTHALALELAPRIRVNAVAPGTVAFPENFDPKKRAQILRRIPLGREGSPDDIGRAVVFLVRDAPYSTGHVLDVDGGFGIS